MKRIVTALVMLAFAGPAIAQVDCNGPGALIYDDGGFENGIGSTATMTHVAQLNSLENPGDRLTSFCVCFSRIPSGSSNVEITTQIWSADGAGGTPNTLLGTVASIELDGIATFPATSWFRINLVEPFDPNGDFYIGPTWSETQFPGLFVCTDESNGTPLRPGYFDAGANAGQQPPPAQLGVDLADNHKALGIRTVMAAGSDTRALDEASLILPGFDFDTQDPNGRTTFFSLANHRTTQQNVTVEYFGKSVQGTPVSTRSFNLASKQTQPVDIRSAGVDSLADADGIAAGLALIGTGTNEDISGDFQRINFGSDFGTGDRLVRPSDFCSMVRHRFLDFGSGTKFQILLNQPPSSGNAYSYTAFNEAGAQLVAGASASNDNLISTTAAALVGGSSFGAIEFDLSASGGGAVFAEYSAFGRFSLETGGECLDSSTFSQVQPAEARSSEDVEAVDPGLLRQLQ